MICIGPLAGSAGVISLHIPGSIDASLSIAGCPTKWMMKRIAHENSEQLREYQRQVRVDNLCITGILVTLVKIARQSPVSKCVESRKQA